MLLDPNALGIYLRYPTLDLKYLLYCFFTFVLWPSLLIFIFYVKRELLVKTSVMGWMSKQANKEVFVDAKLPICPLMRDPLTVY